MNKFGFLLVACGFLSATATFGQTASVKLKVDNSLDVDRKDEPVVLNLSDIKTNFKVRSAKVFVKNVEIASQLDDLDSDGKFDELAFVLDIKKNEHLDVDVVLSAEKRQNTYPARVYADMQMSDKNKKYPEIQILSFPGNVPANITYGSVYHHGPEFESEYTAYRIYFDNRQSIDIYGKQKHQLELATTRFYTSKEQKDAGYGSDVLWAGKSVSLGSFRGWDGNNPTYVDSVELRTEAMRAYGPVRTVVDIIDRNWYYNGKELNMTQRYILYAGHRDVEVQVRFDEVLGSDDVFCTGVMKLPTNNVGMFADGIAASWGVNQPEPKDPTLETVGLGVCVPSCYTSKTVEDDTNYLFLLSNKGGCKLSYHLTFCAEKEEKGIKNPDDWFAYMKNLKVLVSSPLRVKIVRK